MKRILIVEDDRALAKGICFALQGELLELTQCHSIASALAALDDSGFELLILDVNLPDGSGLDLMVTVKQRFGIPVILLTANDMETDVVAGFELGADDYITKPFSLAILQARVKACLRKHAPASRAIFEQDALLFDFDGMEFFCNGRRIELSKTEQRLLRALVDNKGLTLTRSTLVDLVWTDGAEYVDENALSVAIKRLRDKLEEQPAKPRYIKTVYGVGYTWAVR